MTQEPRGSRKTVTDCGPQFAACMMSELYRQLGIKHAMSSAFHPQSNGQTEWTNQEIVKYLCMFCSKDQQGWAKLLPIAEFAYNLHMHLVTKSSPFKMLYGYQPTWNTPPGASAQMPSVSAHLLELHKAVTVFLGPCMAPDSCTHFGLRPVIFLFTKSAAPQRHTNTCSHVT
jgi:hypothetical protein